MRIVASARGRGGCARAALRRRDPALRGALERYLAHGAPPTPRSGAVFRYPALSLVYSTGRRAGRRNRRAFAKFSGARRLHHHGHAAAGLPALSARAAAAAGRPSTAPSIEVGLSDQEIPYPYVLERGDELGRGDVTAAELARLFPDAAAVGGGRRDRRRRLGACARASRARCRCSTRCASTTRCGGWCTTPARDWRHVQPWILLTNYHRYVDQFVRWGLEQLAQGRALRRAGAARRRRASGAACAAERGRRAGRRLRPGTASRCRPTTSVARRTAQGVTLVNIGVGPSNAKNITDHLAVLRPHCWLMVGPLRRPARSRSASATTCWRTPICGRTASSTRWCRPTCRSRRWPRCRWRCRTRPRRSPGRRARP